MPFFDRKRIGDITAVDLDDYARWCIAYYRTGPGSQIGFETYERKGVKIRRPVRQIVPTRSAQERELSVLKQIFNYAVRRDYIDANRVPDFPKPRGKTNRRPTFDKREVEQMRSVLTNEYLSYVSSGDLAAGHPCMLLLGFVDVGITTGMRFDELLKLRWKHINRIVPKLNKDVGRLVPEFPSDLHIDVPSSKTGIRRVYPIEAVDNGLGSLWILWVEITGNPPGADDPVFFDAKRNLMTARAPRCRFTRFLEANGLRTDVHGQPRTPYSLRHHYATRMILESEASDLQFARNMGTSVDMLERHYAHEMTARENEALRNSRKRRRRRSAAETSDF